MSHASAVARRERRVLTRGEALAAWDILVELAGAVDAGGRRDEFLRAATRDRQVEFRFQGSLGFGGKFYYDGDLARVGCYPEDRTALRDAVVACATARLAWLLHGPAPAPTRGAIADRLRACAAAMEAVAAAQAARDRHARARREPDRAARPSPSVVRATESTLASALDRLAAESLRAREALRCEPVPEAER